MQVALFSEMFGGKKSRRKQFQSTTFRLILSRGANMPMRSVEQALASRGTSVGAPGVASHRVGWLDDADSEEVERAHTEAASGLTRVLSAQRQARLQEHRAEQALKREREREAAIVEAREKLERATAVPLLKDDTPSMPAEKAEAFEVGMRQSAMEFDAHDLDRNRYTADPCPSRLCPCACAHVHAHVRLP